MSLWKIHVENLLRWGMLGNRLYIMRGHPFDQGKSAIVKPFVLTELEQYAFVGQDQATLDDSRNPASTLDAANDTVGFLQACADAAWEAGIYPRQLADHSSELKATKYHLEDMRQISGVKK